MRVYVVTLSVDGGHEQTLGVSSTPDKAIADLLSTQWLKNKGNISITIQECEIDNMGKKELFLGRTIQIDELRYKDSELNLYEDKV